MLERCGEAGSSEIGDVEEVRSSLGSDFVILLYM